MTDTPDPPSTGGASSQALIASILTVFLISIAVTAYVAHRSSRFEPIREAVRVRMAGFRFSRGLDPDLIARIPIVKYHDGPVAKDTSEVATHHHRETVTRETASATTPLGFWSQLQKTVIRIIPGNSTPKNSTSAAREFPSSCSICTEDFAEGDDLEGSHAATYSTCPALIHGYRIVPGLVLCGNAVLHSTTSEVYC